MNFRSGPRFRAISPRRGDHPSPDLTMRDLRVHNANALFGFKPPSATIPSNQVGKLGNEGVAMRTFFSRASRSLPLLTSRRHVDLHRTASAICRPV
ncbi:putative leader peptide [Streptomyces massasporeus]|uniref:putative leader peptide n=1 Tax=Streptomyces massasporeus TaxID=67324 RepID=UPI0033A10ABF